jgi:Cu+-exporting ATPase
MQACFHCGSDIELGIDIEEIINNKKERFCCTGCSTVASLIYNSGNEKFYDLKGSSSLKPEYTSKEYLEENINSEHTYKKFVSGTKENSEAIIHITNIHCSACVWLNEKFLLETEGVKEVRINFANGKAKVIWDDNKIKLYQILEVIKSIGYKGVLYSSLQNSKQEISSSNYIFIRMAVAGFCFGNIMLFSAALYAGYFSGIDTNFKKLLHYISWLLATPAYLYSGSIFMKSAYHSLKKKMLTVDTLLFIGVSLSYFYSIYVTLSDIGEVYFDSVCMIYFFILIGKYLEAKVREYANLKTNLLLSKLPEITTRITDGEEQQILSPEIEPEDILLIKAGERIPVDGILLSDSAYLDESFLTGESKSIHKYSGDQLLAGSLTLDGALKMEARSKASNSTLGNLKKLVDNAMLEKPAVQRITDTIANRFVKIVFIVASLTFVGWYFFSTSIETPILNMIAVMIVACPCALGLSVPMSLIIGNLSFSKKGILIKNPDIIETLSGTDTILLDKTGTLTKGILEIANESLIKNQSVYDLVYVLEKQSTHPLAKALVNYLKPKTKIKPDEYTIQQSKEISGKGIEGIISILGQVYDVKIGNKKFITSALKKPNAIVPQDQSGTTQIYISIDGILSGMFALRDTMREGMVLEIAKLRQLIPDIHILSGDSESAVKIVADELHITEYKSELSPEEKLQELELIQSRGKNVLMVGDGMNDSAVLARANTGVSLEIGSDLSIDKSDVLLLENDLSNIRIAILYSRLVRKVIRQNITISFLYNSVMIPLAAFGFMKPVYCALFMTLSSLTVIGNALSINLRKRNYT